MRLLVLYHKAYSCHSLSEINMYSESNTFVYTYMCICIYIYIYIKAKERGHQLSLQLARQQLVDGGVRMVEGGAASECQNSALNYVLNAQQLNV